MSFLFLVPLFLVFLYDRTSAQSACASFEFEAVKCTQTVDCCYLSENLQPRPSPGAEPSQDWETERMCASIDDYKVSRVQARGLSVEGFLQTIKSNETEINMETLCRVEGSYVETNTQTLINPFFCQCTGQPVGLGNFSALGLPYQAECEKYDTSSPGDTCFAENADCYYISGVDAKNETQKFCKSLQALNFEAMQRSPGKSLQESLVAIGISGIEEIVDTNLCKIYGLLPKDMQLGELANTTCWTADPSTSTF